ncbi:MAG: hypothetical protein HDT49_03790 [Lactobacillus sp.]|nr:hypothetical protein [Lactobacillus sp.]
MINEMKKQRLVINIGLFALFLVISIVYVYPFMRTGKIYAAGDFMFQINRIHELTQDFAHGVFIPRISSYSMNQVGSGINFFYPWISIIPFALLNLIIKNPVNSYYVGLILENFITLLIAYYSYNHYSQNKKAATLFSLFYFFATYRLYLMTSQFVLAESLAYMFIPLAFLGFYEVVWGKENEWILLSLGMTFLIYSHMLTSALVALIFVLLLIGLFKTINNRKRRLIALCKAVGICLLLTSIFLIPFFEQTLSNKTTASWTGITLISTPGQMLDNSLRLEPVQTIGLILVIGIIMGLLYFGKLSGVGKTAFVTGIGLTILTTSVFPWKLFESTPINNLQFPYRFLGIASFLLCIPLTELVLIFIQKKLNRQTFIICLTLLCTLLIGITYYGERDIIKQRLSLPELSTQLTPKHYLPSYTYGGFIITAKSYDNMLHFYQHNGATDYYPQTASAAKHWPKTLSIIEHIAYVNGRAVKFKNMTVSRPNELIFDVSEIANQSKIDLPVLYYHNDQVFNERNQPIPYSISKRGTITVKKDPTLRRVKVKYVSSFVDKLSVMVTCISWVILFIYLIIQFRRKQNVEN